MELVFLGTASAEGYPATFCSCPNCAEARRRGGRNIRARACMLVNGEVLIDMPPDAARRSVDLGVSLGAVRLLLITHSHEDHAYVDELRLRRWPFTAMPLGRLAVVCNERVAELIRAKLGGQLGQLSLDVVVVHPGDRVRLHGYCVTALRAKHAPETGEEALVYVVERDGKKVLYACDTGPLPRETLDALESMKLDAAIVDSTLGLLSSKVFAYHMGLTDVVELRRWMVEKGVLGEGSPFIATHFSHLSCPLHEEMEALLKPYGVTPAYDGLRLEV